MVLYNHTKQGGQHHEHYGNEQIRELKRMQEELAAEIEAVQGAKRQRTRTEQLQKEPMEASQEARIRMAKERNRSEDGYYILSES